MTDQTIHDLASIYAEKLKESDTTSMFHGYQLALMDLIYHQLEALSEELRYIHNVIASKG